jgi:hypothetical protein
VKITTFDNYITYKKNEIRVDTRFPPLPEGDYRIVLESTKNFRPCVGRWEINNNKLHLISIAGTHNLISNTKILADWITGTLIIPNGERPRGWVVYENEIHLTINKGLVVKTKDIDNTNKIRYLESTKIKQHLESRRSEVKKMQVIIKQTQE